MIAGRVARHVQLLAILWLVISGLRVGGGGILLGLALTVFSPSAMPAASPPGAPGFLQPLFMVLGGYVLLQALVGFAAGWGLLQRESWARTLTLVLGILALLDFPLGTMLGIYTLWVLLSPQAEHEYRQLVGAPQLSGQPQANVDSARA
jgi:hypothetical protein